MFHNKTPQHNKTHPPLFRSGNRPPKYRFLSQKRVGVGGFRPIISVILLFFFPWKTWKYAIVNSNCALLSVIFSDLLADNKFVFYLKKKTGGNSQNHTYYRSKNTKKYSIVRQNFFYLICHEFI